MPAVRPTRADVEHVGQALQAHRGVGPVRLELLGALEQLLVAIEVERRERRPRRRADGPNRCSRGTARRRARARA